MRLPSASLGFKLNVALLLFVLVLGAATCAIVLFGYSRTQDNATERSQQALEEEGKLALQALAGGVSESGALQFETAAEVGQRAGRYMQDFRAGGGTPVYDISRLIRTEGGIWYDPDPARVSDVVVVNHQELEGAVLDDIAYSAALDPLYPAFAEGFPGQVSGEAYNPIAIIYIGVSGVGRYYPPIGIVGNTPAEVDVSDFEDRFGSVANPKRETVWTSPYEDLQGHGLVITARTPVYNGDTFRGLFEVDLSIARLVELVNQIKPTPNGFTFYVDTEGGILQTDSFQFLSGEAQTNTGLSVILQAMTQPTEQPSVAVDKVMLGGEEYFIAHTPMLMPGGSIGVAAPIDELTAQAAEINAGIEDEGNRTFLAMLAAMGALFVVGLVGATYLNRTLLLSPLSRLFAGTRAVAAGDLDTTVDLHRGDELGMLADSFNTMVDRLRESERDLERQVEVRTQELSVLLDVSRELTAARSLRGLSRTILEQLKRVVDYTGSSALEFDGNVVRIVEAEGPLGREEGAIGLQANIETSAELWERIRRGGSVIIDDVRGDSKDAALWRETWKAQLNDSEVAYIRSWMAIPLGLGGQVVGLLSMSKDIPGYYTHRHLDLAQAISRQAEVVAENANLLESTQRRTQETSALLEVSRAVSSTLDLGEVLGTILDQLDAITEHTGASILLFREDALEFVDARSMTGTTAPQGTLIPYSAAPDLTAMLRRGETVIIDDIQSDDRLAVDYRAAITSIGLMDRLPFDVIRSWMAVPLALKDRVLGILTISWTEPGHFTDDHARLARAFADQAATAIENARLFEQTGQVAALEERQRLARELHDSVSQALYGIALGARTARTILDRDPAKAVEPVEYVLSLAEAGLAEMRALIFELRPESLESEGLVAALEKQVAATRARYGLEIATELAEEPDIGIAQKEAFYRIAQEALHNVVKHAHATTVQLSLANSGGNLTLSIADDGDGFDPAGDYPGHLGLRSMKERAERAGATLAIDSGPGAGARVTLTLPLG